MTDTLKQKYTNTLANRKHKKIYQVYFSQTSNINNEIYQSVGKVKLL